MPSTSDGMPALSVPKRRSLQSGWLIKLLTAAFFSLFAGAGALLIWSATIGPLINVMRAAFWQPVPCTIQSSQVVGLDTFQIDIRYVYLFGPQEYSGKDYSFFNLKTSGRAGKENVVRRYPPKSQTTCYVNPGRPDESVLNRSVQWSILWGLGGVPFLLVGVIGLFLAYVRRLRDKRKEVVLERRLDGEPSRRANSPSPLVTTQSFSEYDDESLREERGALELAPEVNLNQAVVGLLFVCLIWNGMILVMSGSLLKNWLHGNWHFLPDLLVVPFALVGLWLIYASVRSLMAMFNPVPQLILSRQMIPLGGSATLSWTYQRPSQSIQQLTIILKGIEEARYTRGTDTLTDTAVFYEEILLETAEPSQIAAGSVEIRIPTDSMHTLNGSKNKILWKIQVNGSIPRWPDAQTTSAFPVVPHE